MFLPLADSHLYLLVTSRQHDSYDLDLDSKMILRVPLSRERGLLCCHRVHTQLKVCFDFTKDACCAYYRTLDGALIATSLALYVNRE